MQNPLILSIRGNSHVTADLRLILLFRFQSVFVSVQWKNWAGSLDELYFMFAFLKWWNYCVAHLILCSKRRRRISISQGSYVMNYTMCLHHGEMILSFSFASFCSVPTFSFTVISFTTLFMISFTTLRCEHLGPSKIHRSVTRSNAQPAIVFSSRYGS